MADWQLDLAELVKLDFPGADVVAVQPAGTTASGDRGPETVYPTGDKRRDGEYLNAVSIGGVLSKSLRNVGAVQAVANAPALLYGLVVNNAQAAITYVQVFYQPAGNVLIGTTIPDLEFQVAASSGYVPPFPAKPLKATFGLSVAATTGAGGGTGSNAGVHVQVLYETKTGAEAY